MQKFRKSCFILSSFNITMVWISLFFSFFISPLDLALDAYYCIMTIRARTANGWKRRPLSRRSPYHKTPYLKAAKNFGCKNNMRCAEDSLMVYIVSFQIQEMDVLP